MAWTKLKFTDTREELVSKKLNREQIEELKKELPFTKMSDLSKKYKCSESLLNHISQYYGIRKDPDFKARIKKEVLTRRNKTLLGRDLSDDFVISVAKKYETKQEFSIKDTGAYSYAKKHGIMDKCSDHMVNRFFSIPQLTLRDITEYIFNTTCSYNNRKAIKPYEIDVYYDKFKLGFEYDGRGWHESDCINKTKLCSNAGISLITIKENNRKYLQDIKDQLKNNLDLINEKTGLIITKRQIDDYNEKVKIPKLFTDDELNLLRNNTASYLYRNHFNLYQRYKRHNPDNKVFTNTIYTEELVNELLSQYKSWSDVYKENNRLYHATMKKFKHLKEKYFNKR